MAYLTRAEELVQTIERDAAFQAAIEGAPTMTGRRQVLDAHGFQDIGLDDMRTYVESKGGKLVVPKSGRELSDDELAAVAGGLSDEDTFYSVIGVSGLFVGVTATLAAASAAA
jgi:hypothetical protein